MKVEAAVFFKFLLLCCFFFFITYLKVEAYCTGSYFCGTNVSQCTCSQPAYSCSKQGDKCGTNTDGKPGIDGVCSCKNTCNPNQGYEVPCTGLAYAQCPGSFPGLGCDCGVSYCKWKPDPPPACSYTVCGGWNPVGGYYCASTARYFNSGCSPGGGCYTSSSCSTSQPTSTPTPRPTTAVPPNQPTPTFTPTPTNTPSPVPVCTPGSTRCGSKCESCGSNSQWYLNASNGCYGGDWNLCDCLNRGGTMASCNPVPTNPPVMECTTECGWPCGKRVNGVCAGNDFACCHRECVNYSCGTWPGPGANTCNTNAECVGQNVPTITTAPTPEPNPPCLGSLYNCSRFTATSETGTVTQAAAQSEANSVSEIPTLDILPGEQVTFAGNIFNSCTTYRTQFNWENGANCVEEWKETWWTGPAEGANWCNTTIQANESGDGDGGVQNINACTSDRDDPRDGIALIQTYTDLKAPACRCKENGIFVPCTQVKNNSTARRFYTTGDNIISLQQLNNGEIDGRLVNNTADPCRINVRVKCPDLTQTPGSITVQDGTANVTATNNAVGFIQNSGNRVVNWPAVTDAVSYSVRVNEFNPGEDESASWSHDCTNLLPGDYCQDVTAPGRQITYQFKPNKQYKIWVHPRNSCGAFGPATTAFFFYAPKGALQTASCANLTGWTCDLDNVNQATQVKFYLDGAMGAGGTSVPGTYVANTTITDPAIIAGCGGNAVHGFNLTLPEAIKDGKQHTIYAYGENIGYFTEDRVLAVPRSVNKCADPWVKINGGSFNNNDSTLHLNKVPAYVEPVDVTDSGLPAFIAGTNQPGAVMQLDIGTYMGTSYSLPHNWRDKTYLTGAAGKFNREQYLNYVKARKNYATISTLSTQITEDGIYAIDGGTNVLQYDGNTTKKMVLIGLGDGGFQLTGNAAGIFNPSNTSIAIIAKKITVDPSVKEINAILITDTFDTGLNANLGLKIKGNLIASQTFTFNRQTVPNQNVVPPLYITQDQQKYLDLMRYLSTSIYEIQEAQ